MWKEISESFVDTELKFSKRSYGNFNEPNSEVLVDGVWYYKIDECDLKRFAKDDKSLPGGDSSPRSECCFTFLRNLKKGFQD